MKVTKPLFSLISLMAVAISLQAGNEKTIQLFDGESLDGWHFYLNQHGVEMSDVWSVKDGVLICKGEPLGYLYTDNVFESFKLIVEWRWAPGKDAGNSGVLMRINGNPQPLPKCFEAQLHSGNAGMLYGFHGMNLDGAPDRKIDKQGGDFTGYIKGLKPLGSNENPVGEWNRYKIILDGESLKTWVNGTLLNEAVSCDVLPGPIGFQSEGGEIHFRKIELTVID